jgi:hypothetical protein
MAGERRCPLCQLLQRTLFAADVQSRDHVVPVRQFRHEHR